MIDEKEMGEALTFGLILIVGSCLVVGAAIGITLVFFLF